MPYKWKIIQNHLAIDSGHEFLHPSADEIYALMDGDSVDGIQIGNPEEEIPEIRFSRIGSPAKCTVESNKNGELVLEVYSVRKNKKVNIDVVDGFVLDHGFLDNEWFYLTGDCQALTDTLKKAGIKETGLINAKQYLSLVKSQSELDYPLIEFKIESVDFNAPSVLEYGLPTELHASLYCYQETGFRWMRNMLAETGGCVLGDEMGLGKTLQVITVFLSLNRIKTAPMLVVAPVSLLENWRQECRKFAPSLKTYIHHGGQRTGRYKDLLKYDVVIISYNTAVSDLSMLKMITWTLVVLDEAQNIKNPYSERSKSVRQLMRSGSIAVSGTPFENHILDVWSLVEFVMPGLLGDISDFKTYYSDDEAGATKIEPVLSPLMLRRLVKDVADDLPEKVVVSQPITMSQEEAESYERMRVEIARDNQETGSISLGVLQKLRMYCTFPSLCDAEVSFSDPTQVSLKYQRLCELIEEIVSRNEKVLVFTSFKKMFDIFMDDIPKRFGIEINAINGETPVNDRQQIVDWFNSYDGSAMLALNPRAAGTGLNITGANHVIHYNPEWNPAIEDQASARAYRRGQKKTVFIYRLFYENTVEQLVDERIERKREIAKSAIVGTVGKDQERDDIIAAINMSPVTGRKENEL